MEDSYNPLTCHEGKQQQQVKFGKVMKMIRLSFLEKGNAILVNPYDIKSIMGRENGVGSTVFIKSNFKDIYYAVEQGMTEICDKLESAGVEIL